MIFNREDIKVGSKLQLELIQKSNTNKVIYGYVTEIKEGEIKTYFPEHDLMLELDKSSNTSNWIKSITVIDDVHYNLVAHRT